MHCSHASGQGPCHANHAYQLHSQGARTSSTSEQLALLIVLCHEQRAKPFDTLNKAVKAQFKGYARDLSDVSSEKLMAMSVEVRIRCEITAQLKDRDERTRSSMPTGGPLTSRAVPLRDVRQLRALDCLPVYGILMCLSVCVCVCVCVCVYLCECVCV